MNQISKYSKFIPYLYYLAVIIFWFTVINRSQGLSAYPILLFGIPFLLQIFKPNRNLNFGLGITFVCVSSYMIIAYAFNALQFVSISSMPNNFGFYVGLFITVNFLMALWIIRNSLKKSF